LRPSAHRTLLYTFNIIKIRDFPSAKFWTAASIIYYHATLSDTTLLTSAIHHF